MPFYYLKLVPDVNSFPSLCCCTFLRIIIINAATHSIDPTTEEMIMDWIGSPITVAETMRKLLREIVSETPVEEWL